MTESESRYLRVFEISVATALAIILLIGFLYIRSREINFCRNVFSDLMQGRFWAVNYIDWEHLKALDMNVGETFSRLPNEKERRNYKKAFIRSLAVGFSRTGTKIGDFSNWRILSKDSEKIIAAADYIKYKKTLLLTFTKSKIGKKLVSLQWQ